MKQKVKQVKKAKKSFILRICIFAFVVYAAVQLVDMQMSLGARKQELSELQVRLETQRLANKDLERQLAEGVDEEYIERVARERLEYVAPDETVFIDVSGS